MITETLDQKIERLEKTIHRCVFQINDIRNTPDIIATFTKAKAEAEKQLRAAKAEKENAAQKDKNAAQELHLSGAVVEKNARISTTDSKSSSQPTIKRPEEEWGSGNHPAVGPHLSSPNGADNTITLVAAPSQTLMIKIEWPGSEKEPTVLGQGEVLNRFTRTLRDCADSHSARTDNWEKFRASKQFGTLCLYYRAYSFFPRPSQDPLPTQEDMGAHYFVGNGRKKIWELIRETVKPEVNP